TTAAGGAAKVRLKLATSSVYPGSPGSSTGPATVASSSVVVVSSMVVIRGLPLGPSAEEEPGGNGSAERSRLLAGAGVVNTPPGSGPTPPGGDCAACPECARADATRASARSR